MLKGKLYIAYGSNLNLIQMAARCPSARIYAKGILNNWELVYRGNKTNSHATIIRCKNSIVPILIWEIQPQDEYLLDRYEGYPHYYFKKEIMATIAGKKRKAMVYIMNEYQKPGIPSPKYVETIRQGYLENNLDITILETSLEKNLIECSII